MRCALIETIGSPPRLADVDVSSREAGDTLISIAAVALNPLDISISSGAFYGGHPPLPYVPGCEAVGTTESGALVYLFGGGHGVTAPGFLADRVAVASDIVLELPEGTDPAVAAAAGIAGIAGWVPVVWLAEVGPGDRVLVLGASGTVGLIAVQAAKARGAEHVVAAGRDRSRLERARELGADHVVELGDPTQLAEAFDGEGFTVCIDPLWGQPLADALGAAATGARVVHLGQSAGAEAPLRSADVRGKQLTIIGHSNFSLTTADRNRAYRELLQEINAGQIQIDLTRFPLYDISAAWDTQLSSASMKVVVEP